MKPIKMEEQAWIITTEFYNSAFTNPILQQWGFNLSGIDDLNGSLFFCGGFIL